MLWPQHNNMASPRNTLQEFLASRKEPPPVYTHKISDEGWICTITYSFEGESYSTTGPPALKMKKSAAETSLIVIKELESKLEEEYIKYIDKDIVIAVDIENIPTFFKTIEKHFNFSNRVHFVCFTSKSTPSGLYIPDRCEQYKAPSSRKDASDVEFIIWCSQYDFTDVDELFIISRDKIMDTVKDCMTNRLPHLKISILRDEESIVSYFSGLYT